MKGRAEKRREGKGREGKGRAEKRRAEKRREGKGREEKRREEKRREVCALRRTSAIPNLRNIHYISLGFLLPQKFM